MKKSTDARDWQTPPNPPTIYWDGLVSILLAGDAWIRLAGGDPLKQIAGGGFVRPFTLISVYFALFFINLGLAKLTRSIVSRTATAIVRLHE